MNERTVETAQVPALQYGSVSDIVATLRRWWWMFLPFVAVAVAAAIVLTSQSTPVYSSEAEVIIRTEESANLFPLSEVDSLLRSPSAEAGFLASTAYEVAADEAAGMVGEVQIDVGDVNSRVEPSFIGFTSTASTPQQAASAAQAWAETYVSMRQERDTSGLLETIETLETRLSELEADRDEHLAPVHALDRTLQNTTNPDAVSRLSTQRLVLLQSVESTLSPIDAQADLVTGELAQLRLVEDFLDGGELSARVNRTADVPEAPIAPSLPRNLALAVVLALVLGAAAVLLAEALDDRVRSATEVTARFGLQSLATVPHRRRDDLAPVAPAGPIAESFHRLASAIDFYAITGGKAKVLLVTSAQASESKTTTVSRLGATLARQGRRTLIIGADMRLPALASRFDEQSGPGLGELLGGLYPFAECVTEVEGHEGLFLLRSGMVVTEASPVDLLRSAALDKIIDEVRDDFDHILIDCPPVLPVVDALEITRVCDGIVLSLFAGQSKFGRVERALSMIMQATRKPILGFVLTGIKGGTDSYTNGYYESRPRRISELSEHLDAPSPSLRPSVRTGSANRTQSPTQGAVTVIEASAMPSPVVKKSSPDDIEFISEPEERDAADGVVSSTKKERRMRALRYLFAVAVALASLATTVAPAGAQYEGDSPETGVLTITADAEILNYVHTGLLPNSELTFELQNADGQVQAGLEVAGAVVVRADANGNYDGSITIPDGLPNGVYTLVVSGTLADTSAFSRDYVINVNNGAAAAVTSPALALTGSSSSRNALNGVLIIAVGAALVTFAARSRKSEAVSIDS